MRCRKMQGNFIIANRISWAVDIWRCCTRPDKGKCRPKDLCLDSAALSSSLTCDQSDIQALIHPNGVHLQVELARFAHTEAHNPSESCSSKHGHLGWDEVHLGSSERQRWQAF